jgi:hypothetical protein
MLIPDDLLLLSAQNAELCALLEETRQYLLRLPPVPVTREFAARLDNVVNQTENSRTKRLGGRRARGGRARSHDTLRR